MVEQVTTAVIEAVQAAGIAHVPFIGLVAPPRDAATLSGEPVRADAVDVATRSTMTPGTGDGAAIGPPV